VTHSPATVTGLKILVSGVIRFVLGGIFHLAERIR
jgi:hypothetical protein